MVDEIFHEDNLNTLPAALRFRPSIVGQTFETIVPMPKNRIIWLIHPPKK